jgi:hypothetical protein
MLPSGGKSIGEMTLISIARSVKNSKGATHATPRMHGRKNIFGFGLIINEMDGVPSGWLRDVTG